MHLPAPTRRLVLAVLFVACAAVLILRLPAPTASRIVDGLALLSILGATAIYLTQRRSVQRLSSERRHAQQSSDLNLATIEVLARAIDAKDQGARLNTRRVQLYASRLAEAVKMTTDEVQGVRTAALLHNVGKLAVPEYILTKPGPLTSDEFERLRVHPQIGAEIVAAVPFPYSVAPIILSHHERWDGLGYPDGLAGEQIPLGARILAIVKYHEMLTVQPQRKAISHDGAVGLLRHERGRALDPELVETFIGLLPQLITEFDKTAESNTPSQVIPLEPVPHGNTAGSAPSTSAPAAGPTAMQQAVQQMALAHFESRALYEIAQSMGTSLTVADTMAVISGKLAAIVPWSACALFLRQPGSNQLRCSFAAGADAPRLRDASLLVGARVAEWAAAGQCTVLGDDRWITIEANGLPLEMVGTSAIVCPLVHAGTLIGGIALYRTGPDRFSEDHRRLVERVAEQAGAVIQNSMTFEQAQVDSLTDPLTSLPNRRSMFLHLARELARAERLKNDLALVVIDLDEFKLINDSHGHAVGDRVLNEVAATLRGALRPYDLCVRYGGDEFVVVLGECSRQRVESKRRELQERIAEIHLELASGHRIHLGASAGAAVFPHDGVRAETLIATADARMYVDKAARRGRAAATVQTPIPSAPVRTRRPPNKRP